MIFGNISEKKSTPRKDDLDNSYSRICPEYEKMHIGNKKAYRLLNIDRFFFFLFRKKKKYSKFMAS